MRRPLAALLLAGSLLAPPAFAGSDEFGSELERLIERAERAKAADPAFLADLRELTGTSYSSYGKEPDIEALEALIDRAERADLRELAQTHGEAEDSYAGSRYSEDQGDDSGRRLLIEDDFADGDYLQNPRWTVAAGEFAVGPEGLRSQVREQRASADNAGEAIAETLLGALTGAGTPRAMRRSTTARTCRTPST
jgi:hypothetical protein